MSLYYETVGKPDSPILVAVHGLMGGVEELKFLDALCDQFCVVFVDFHHEFKKQSIATRDLTQVDYDHGSDMIAQMLEKDFHGRPSYFYGSSYGGKIIFDFMAKFPALYAGAVFGDISPAPIHDTEFHQLTSTVVPQLDMGQDWNELKKQIKSLIPDRHARSLLASQIYYPENEATAIWRTGIIALDHVMVGLEINNQWPIFEKICQCRDKENVILVAERLSSISEESRKKLEQSQAFTLKDIAKASHFINITHHRRILQEVRELTKEKSSV